MRTESPASGGAGLTARGVMGAESGTRIESFTGAAVMPMSIGNVCAVTS